MKDRIKQLMEAQHVNQQAFAAMTGIGSASLSSIFTGRTKPTLNHVEAILNTFPNISPIWLVQGKGGMMLPSENVANSLSEQEGVSSETIDNATLFGGIASDSSNPNSPTPSKGLTSFSNAGCGSDIMADAQVQSPYYKGRGTASTQRQGSASRAGMSFMTDHDYGMAGVQRRITEIRVFYDDQTWESFVPKTK